MSKLKKPKWGKPKLIVITRGNKQERVLAGCKDGPAGPYYDNNACLTDAVCYACDAWSAT